MASALLAGLITDASAHSIILLDGRTYIPEYTAVKAVYRIQHACTESGLPVIGQSFILPTVNPIVKREDGGKIEDLNFSGSVDLADVIDAGSLIGQVQPFIDTSVFKQRQLKSDSLGNTIGFSSTGGNIPDKFYAEIPFLIPSVGFIAQSCASQMIVHPVGADICKTTNPPALGDANIWVEHTTSKFPNLVHGVGENELRLVYKRTLSTNPLPTNKNCGQGYTVDVYASDKDINANLPIKISGKAYWPR
jgi:hypothetical protein